MRMISDGEMTDGCEEVDCNCERKVECYFKTMNQPAYYLFLLHELYKVKDYGKMQRKLVAELGA